MNTTIIINRMGRYRNRRLFIYSLLCVIAFAVNIQISSAQVVISEVFYDTPENEDQSITPCHNGEYIELYNNYNRAIDLSGWKIKFSPRYEVFDFQSITIAGKSSLVICYQYKDSGFSLTSLFLSAASGRVVYHNSFILPNTKSTIYLIDDFGRIADEMSYGGTTGLTASNGTKPAASCYSLQRTAVHYEDGVARFYTGDYMKRLANPCTVNAISFVNTGTYVPSMDESKNYILSATMTKPVSSGVINESNAMVNIQYYDGLGRPFETVQKGITPSKSNLVSYLEYDACGRESNQWLPVVTGNNYVDYPDLLQEANYYYSTDSRPYSYPVYESSPLNRVVAQYGPGSAWNNNPVSTDYLTNAASGDLCCKYYSVNSSESLVCNGDYSSGQLYVTKSSDEDGNVIYTFTDKSERAILTRQISSGEHVDTYYVYDDIGNLRYVLPPLASDYLRNPGTYSLSSNDALKLYAYYYRYDKRNRCIEKKLPGIEPIYMVYDKSDRLILSQTGKQRPDELWTVNKYDLLGRLLYTTETADWNSFANLLEQFSGWLVTESFTTGSQDHPMEDTGYSRGFYHMAPSRLLTVNYYDDYRFMGLLSSSVIASLVYRPVPGYGTRYENSKGLLTGTRVYDLDGSGNYVSTAFYYDDKGNQIQANSTNHLGGFDRNCMGYSFTNKLLCVSHTHSGPNSLSEVYNYTYDHADRLIKVTHQLNNDAAITLAENSYDEFGRLQSKKIKDGLDVVSYGYNIRSWLTSINSTSFNQKLHYEDQSLGATICYNGNISSMDWNISEDFTRRYNFLYDDLSRLTKANYLESKLRENTEYNHYENQPMYDTEYSYDKQGNMSTLIRKGLRGKYEVSAWPPLESAHSITSIEYGFMDYLSFTQKGNQLLKIDDLASDVLYEGAFDFVDGYKGSGVEYVYDENGNMIQDRNKGVSQIQYNLLNLPDKIQFQPGHMTNTAYGADGIKYRVSHLTAIDNVSIPMGNLMPLSDDQIQSRLVTDYCGNLIYENGELKKVLIDGGYISFTGSSPNYHFYVKDHQGNNRVVLSGDGRVEESNHYYPFGGLFGESCLNTDPYKYNGKELDRMHGLNWYDYSARQYDPMIGGGFPSMDPLCEKYYSISPYAYCGNNPVRYVDFDGMQASDTIMGGKMLPEVVITGKKVAEPISGIWGNISYFLFGRTYNAPVYGVTSNSNLSAYPIGYTTFNVDRNGYVTNLAPIGGVAPLPSTTSLNIREIKELLKVSRILSKGGLTAVGRALKKHSDRQGSAFPKAVGNPATVNVQGEAVLKSILENPSVKIKVTRSRTVGEVLDYVVPGGMGARFSSDGKTFIGFLEPNL